MYETIQEDTDKKEIPLSCDGPHRTQRTCCLSFLIFILLRVTLNSE